jgi:hypothetical protein
MRVFVLFNERFAKGKVLHVLGYFSYKVSDIIATAQVVGVKKVGFGFFVGGGIISSQNEIILLRTILSFILLFFKA